jgi:hypothetical protein
MMMMTAETTATATILAIDQSVACHSPAIKAI